MGVAQVMNLQGSNVCVASPKSHCHNHHVRVAVGNRSTSLIRMIFKKMLNHHVRMEVGNRSTSQHYSQHYSHKDDF